MLPLILILLPIIAGAAVCCAGPRVRLALRLTIGTAILHIAAAATAYACYFRQTDKWLTELTISGTPILAFPPFCRILLILTSLLFTAVSIHTFFWLPAEQNNLHRNGHASSMSPSLFLGCMLFFLGAMYCVICAGNPGFLWAAMEATTLASAPLVFYHKTKDSLEAMWKYILICSIGIGLALLGTMFLTVGQNGNAVWLKAAFILALTGYGTKMGLAPFHAWLPDAHSEAPGGASAMLSGALLNCAFLAVILFYNAVSEISPDFCRELLLVLGLVSLSAAAFFIIHQANYKRMLAYSSVEHMGLLAIMAATPGLSDTICLHIAGHSLIKLSLFLLAGNILLAYGTCHAGSIGGMFGRLPRTAIFWTIGILMICGAPPSPLFITEFKLIQSLNPWLATIVLILLFAIFAGMTQICLQMCMEKEKDSIPSHEDAGNAERLSWIPAIVLTTVLATGCVLVYHFIIQRA